MILVDLNQVMISNLMAQLNRPDSNVDVDEDLARPVAQAAQPLRLLQAVAPLDTNRWVALARRLDRRRVELPPCPPRYC